MRAIPEEAVDIVARWEGCKLTAYQDIVGVWTVGYGSTGTHVKPGMKITNVKAKELLRDDLKIAARRLVGVIKAPVLAELTDNQYSALISFVFNLGANAKWTIWKRLNARQFDQVPGEIMKFTNAGGRRVQGLVNRRTDEVKLWSTDEPGTSDDHMPSSVTRLMETPPTPSDPISPGKSGTIITAALSAAGAVPVAAKQVSDTIAPYADQSPWIGQMVAVVATLAAAAAVLVLVLTWIKKREARQ